MDKYEVKLENTSDGQNSISTEMEIVGLSLVTKK